jgi:TonB family protein
MAMSLIDRPALARGPAAPLRAGGAAASLTLHCTILLVLVAALRAAPDIVTSNPVTAAVPERVVWMPHRDAGGGTFGASAPALQPPRRARATGRDATSVPTPADVSDRITNDAPQELPSIPARPMGDSFTTLAGAIEGRAASDALGSGNPAAAGNDHAGSGTFGEGAERGPGVRTPTLILQVKPRYTDDAMRLRIQGSVWVECVVLPDGTVGDLRVMRSLDSRFGLDDEAIAAAKKWRFRPGTLNGQPVPVVVSIELMFSLR